MKKLVWAILTINLFIATSAQELQHDAIAINIEVPVRVFKGDQFIDHLTMADFLVYEDGHLQKIEAVYLIKKTDIQREDTRVKKEEARKRFVPQVSRNFVLIFEVTDYLPKIKEAIAFFFENVIAHQDSLTVVTPIKTYRFNKKALVDIPREEISALLNEKLRKDITTGCLEYHSMLRDYKYLMNSAFPMDQKLYLLRQKIREFRQLRDMNEKKINNFADYVKNMPGQKFVFLFYQRELFPYPELPFESFEHLELLSELMTLVPQNIEKIKQRFSDSSVAIHFLYITKPQKEIAAEYNSRQEGVMWEDISAGIFSTFLEMAQSTGGVAESSANIAFSLEKAAEASENYYLLYYSPKNYRADGKFREIKVKVKGQDCRVTHRAGYFAD
jgi:VWFA-related protein